MEINKETIELIKTRFEKNMHRHQEIKWEDVQAKLLSNPEKISSLHQMEVTGGEPDVIAYDQKSNEYLFCDCSKESPKGRRSVCYDHEALEARKKHKPENSAINMAKEMGIEILNEEQYRKLQTLENFDLKTSSWIRTPSDIRELGGAIFADYRYGKVFVYHNGADSYYSSRGFRGMLRV
jgi:hypothetical protein